MKNCELLRENRKAIGAVVVLHCSKFKYFYGLIGISCQEAGLYELYIGWSHLLVNTNRKSVGDVQMCY